MEVFRTPDARFEDLPGFPLAPHYFTPDGDLAGLRMHYLDEGSGDPILLLHGEPTWSYDLSDEVIAAYEAPWPTPESKAGVASFPLLVPLSETDPGAAEMIRTGEALAGWGTPVLVAFSDSDPIFPQAAGERMAARIPGARFTPITGASHFLQEDKGEEIGAAILDFLTPRVSH